MAKAKMILGRKIGMTQVFSQEGIRIPVTVVQAGPMTVIGKRTPEKDGYSAIRFGFEDAKTQQKGDSVRYRGLTKAEVGVYEAAGIEQPKRIVRELRCEESELDDYEIGQEVDVSAFFQGEYIDVTATSKGRGFAGVMKRHNFRGMNATHGAHKTHRAAGSIGQSAWPGKVFKGKKMAGRMGNEQVTTQNLQIINALKEDNVLLIKGSFAGHKGSLVRIEPASKKYR